MGSLLALALALAAAATPAAPPWDGPPLSADPRALLAAAAALPPAHGASVDVLLDEGTWRFDARGAATFTQRILFRPLAPEAARRWARVERGWAPWHQARPEVRARVIGPDGAVRELDPGTLVEQGVATEGEVWSDRRLLTGPLPGVVPGALVEELATVRDLAPLFDGGVVHRHALAQPGPIRVARLRIEAPEALPLRWVVRGVELAPAVRVEAGVRTVIFERRDVPEAPRTDPAPPRDAPPAPVVLFGWGRSWTDAAERYGALWRARLDAGPPPDAARAAVRGATGAEAISRATGWIRERVRYTGLELGEAAVVPATPAETVRRGYGDCKDLALLLVALLREAGLDARIALLRTAWLELSPELPGLGQLDHAVVRVEGTPAVWIDPTDRFAPPGELPPQDQGRLALVTGPGVAGLVETPAPGPEANAAETLRELRLAELGPGRVTETRTLRGALAAAEREFRASLPPGRGEELELRYAREVFRADDLVAAEVTGERDLAAPLRVRVEADRSDVVETQDDVAEIPLPPDLVFDPLPRFVRGEAEDGAPGADAPPIRTADLVLALPYRWALAYRVIPPDGFRPRPPLPQDGVERFGPASFARSFALLPDGSVEATFRFDAGGRRVPAADADALARRVREIVRGRSPTVTFERTGAALLAAGRVPEALAEVRRLAALHPREALHRLHLALALVHLGLAGAAEAEARRAIALEPDRAWAHRVLAFVLEHDAVGRFHGPGFDRAGALAAYEAARTRDPQHPGGRAALAELFAHDDRGVRHGPGADLGRAIAEYRSIGDELGNHDFEEGLLAALFAAGRHAEAARLARTLAPGTERNAILVAATAIEAGAGRGDEAASHLGAARRVALRDGAMLLLRQRRHAPAAALVAAAARGGPEPEVLAAQAELFAALRPWEELAREGDDVDRLVRGLLAAAVRGDAAAEVTAAAPRLAAVGAAPALVAGLPLPPAQARRVLRETGLPADALLDLVLSGAEAVRAGDLDGGLRVRLSSAFTTAGPVPAVYVQREGGALRLVATDAAWPLLGAEAARRAAAGDAAGAGRWLDWAREVVPGAPGDPGSPAGLLAALWPPGASGAEAALRAGTALAAHGDPRGAAAPALRAMSEAAPDPAARRALSRALAVALRARGDAEGTLRVADALLAAAPGAHDAFAAKAWALRRLGRPAELAPAAAAFLAAAPDDPDAVALVGSAQLLAGDRAGAARTFRRAIDAGRALPLVYNDAAWLALFEEPPGPLAVDWARRAAGAGPDGERAAQNTLAAAYAAAGRPAEAREVFLRSLEEDGPLAGADWYVFGRIAEAWGERGSARAAYARVEPARRGDEDDPSDAWHLAQRGLARVTR